jgi:hypothetical protein
MSYAKLTLKADFFSGEGLVGNASKFRENPALLRMDLLNDWIGAMSFLLKQAEKDLHYQLMWTRFRANSKAEGLLKLFIAEANFVEVNEDIVFVSVNNRALMNEKVIEKASTEFGKLVGNDVTIVCVLENHEEKTT